MKTAPPQNEELVAPLLPVSLLLGVPIEPKFLMQHFKLFCSYELLRFNSLNAMLSKLGFQEHV